MLVTSFAESRLLAESIAERLNVPFALVEHHRFPDGETLVRVPAKLSSSVVFVTRLDNPDPRLFPVLLVADALRRGGVRRRTLIAPYLPYMRQDRVFQTGEPVSQQVLGRLLSEAFERVVTMEPHLHRIRRLGEVMPGKSVSAAPRIAEWVAEQAPGALLVGPDEESAPWIRDIARRANLPWVVGRKQRLGDREVRLDLPPLPAVSRAVIVDDIASSGTTLAAAARALRQAGLRQVEAVVVHAIFAPGAEARIRRAGIGRIVSCDTLPHPTNAISCASLLAAAVAPRSRKTSP